MIVYIQHLSMLQNNFCWIQHILATEWHTIYEFRNANYLWNGRHWHRETNTDERSQHKYIKINWWQVFRNSKIIIVVIVTVQERKQGNYNLNDIAPVLCQVQAGCICHILDCQVEFSIFTFGFHNMPFQILLFINE